ncbi:hypothetical protein DFP72DRAFT_31402 [Ephemerocybe angulata]|uniref:BTB domain-containing protein n=1 Tax=Ephemerocybe angulata TaxID=980116 RepID=A0A8H6I8W0_9AGAR|nr:hypothetical protein DFP72DRAFT_31402 [Tulosesus angulatus]
MDNSPQAIIVPESLSSVTEPAIEKDEYYWSENVRFLVQGKLFRVSRHQFIIGSKYFSEKYHLGGGDDEGTTDIVQLDDVTAAEFRVFLRILFPSFTKVEWLTILKLSVRWHFHDFRKLAIEHLDGTLTDIELIKVGRAAYVPRWVLSGYQNLVEREGIITIEEADDIGNRTVNTLWIVRYLVDRKTLDGAIENELAWRFSDEVSMLEAEEVQRRTAAEIELEAKRAEEERRLEEERRVKAAAEQADAAERERLEEERARREEELKAARLLEAESHRGRSALVAHPEPANADMQESPSLLEAPTLKVDISRALLDALDALKSRPVESTSTRVERKAKAYLNHILRKLEEEGEEVGGSGDSPVTQIGELVGQVCEPQALGSACAPSPSL